MSNPWSADGQPFPPPPAHPQAETIARQVAPFKALLASWGWDTHGDTLVLYLMFNADHATMRLTFTGQDVNADVFCVRTEPDPHKLTWLLMRNLMRRWKARAAHREGDGATLLIFLEADFAGDADLASIIWDGMQESWRWRGQFILWERFPLN